MVFTHGPKSLKLLYSIMNLNTISLPWVVGKVKNNKLDTEGGPSVGGRERPI